VSRNLHANHTFNRPYDNNVNQNYKLLADIRERTTFSITELLLPSQALQASISSIGSPTGTTRSREIMCKRITEVFPGCGHIYFVHAVDPCAMYNQYGHYVTELTNYVGHKCEPCKAADEAAARRARGR
jgi:hypothetical protein